MPGLLGKMIFRLKFKDDNLLTFSLTFSGRRHFSALYGRLADGDIFIVRDEENFIELYLVSLGGSGKVYINRFSRNDFILFSTRFNNRVNGTPPKATTLYCNRREPFCATHLTESR